MKEFYDKILLSIRKSDQVLDGNNNINKQAKTISSDALLLKIVPLYIHVCNVCTCLWL